MLYAQLNTLFGSSWQSRAILRIRRSSSTCSSCPLLLRIFSRYDNCRFGKGSKCLIALASRDLSISESTSLVFSLSIATISFSLERTRSFIILNCCLLDSLSLGRTPLSQANKFFYCKRRLDKDYEGERYTL